MPLLIRLAKLLYLLQPARCLELAGIIEDGVDEGVGVVGEDFDFVGGGVIVAGGEGGGGAEHAGVRFGDVGCEAGEGEGGEVGGVEGGAVDGGDV